MDVHYRSEQETQAATLAPYADETARRTSPGEDAWSGSHPVNIRLTIPLFVNRYYLTIVAGRDRRSPERLVVERRKHPLRTVGNVIVALVAGTVIGLAFLTMLQLAIVAALRDTL